MKKLSNLTAINALVCASILFGTIVYEGGVIRDLRDRNDRLLDRLQQLEASVALFTQPEQEQANAHDSFDSGDDRSSGELLECSTDTPVIEAPTYQPKLIVYVTTGCPPCEYVKQQVRSISNPPFNVQIVNSRRFSSYPRVYLSTPSGSWRVWKGAVSAASILAEFRKYHPDGTDSSLNADEQPTPMQDVREILNRLKPKASETLVDYGCGDGRVLIDAVKRFGCRAVGVEIDPQRAEQARTNVAEAGLSGRVEIIEGDATTVDVQADVGFVYLWEPVLRGLSPKLKKLQRFASYRHSVPGLPMMKSGDTFYRVNWAEYGGQRYYWDSGSRYWDSSRRYNYDWNCGCSMCRLLRHDFTLGIST